MRTSVTLDDAGRRGWDKARRSTGCSFAALVEAIGRALDRDMGLLPPEVIEEARNIQADRDAR